MSRLRITAGSLRGRGLVVPRGIRPTEARVREALFSIWGERVAGARFLDLFAGSGAVGIEAVSRGAREAWLLEGGKKAIGVLEHNCRELEEPSCHATRAKLPGELIRFAAQHGEGPGGHFDLVFADPPYDFDAYEALLAGAAPLLAANGSLAIEHSIRRELPDHHAGLDRADERSYGETRLSFYRRAAAAVG